MLDSDPFGRLGEKYIPLINLENRQLMRRFYDSSLKLIQVPSIKRFLSAFLGLFHSKCHGNAIAAWDQAMSFYGSTANGSRKRKQTSIKDVWVRTVGESMPDSEDDHELLRHSVLTFLMRVCTLFSDVPYPERPEPIHHHDKEKKIWVNEAHPWAKEVLQKLPTFHPQVMIHSCIRDCPNSGHATPKKYWSVNVYSDEAPARRPILAMRK